ncbi:hypothetical protein [Halobaculum sp. D14]|uniref:hypothetical protein n=1 Tax=Halobaculum sp. D14 TaxID=3421642 RepID=UPI003EB9B288
MTADPGADSGADRAGDPAGDVAEAANEDAATDGDSGGADADRTPVTITSDLLSVLLEQAAEADPSVVNVVLNTTPARDLTGVPPGVDPETPVLTHFYFPGASGSVTAVFGMDLGRPRGRARFLSHPDGDPTLTEADDLAAAVLVATPPYDQDDVVAYDRSGDRLELRVLEATPPEEHLDG